MSVALRNWRCDDHPQQQQQQLWQPSKSHIQYLVSGPWCIGWEHCTLDSWEWRMEKDDLSQTSTGWSVEYSLHAAILSLTSVSFLVSTSQMNRRVAMLLPAKWVLNGSQRECTEIEKSTGTCYTPRGIYITGKIMSKVLLSVWLNGSSSGKWLWFQQRFPKRHSQSIWGWSTSLIIT